MKNINKKYGFIFFSLLFSLFLTSCTSPLKLNYMAGDAEIRMTSEVSIKVLTFKDARTEAGTDEIGQIEATVFDIESSKLRLLGSVRDVITDAIKKELTSSGFKVVEVTGKEATYLLEGEVVNFSLDIKERDVVDIKILASLKDRATGKVLWSGESVVGGSRFVGVSGNTRTTIREYLSASLDKAITKIINDLASEMFWPLERVYKKESTNKAQGLGLGKLQVNSVPSGGKLYVNDIYYGTTPMTLELSPDIYKVEVKLNNHEEEIEKVSVRRAETTELLVELRKE